jgi:hypothetical protein
LHRGVVPFIIWCWECHFPCFLVYWTSIRMNYLLRFISHQLKVSFNRASHELEFGFFESS